MGAIIGGLFVWLPFLWTMKYKPTHTYEMIPLAVENVSTTKVQKLLELKELFDKKLITKEEYEKQKERVLQKEGN